LRGIVAARVSLENVSRPKYIFALAAISGAVLAIGGVLRPAKQAPQLSVRETELQRYTQRRAPQEMTSYFVDAASRTAPYIASGGVGWDEDGLIVAARGKTVAPLELNSPQLPFVTARIAGPLKPTPAMRRLAAELDMGEWLIQVLEAPNTQPIFVPGVFGGYLTNMCGGLNLRELVINAPLRIGAAVFDTDARLAGVVVNCGERLAAVSVGEIEARLKEARGLHSQLISRLGMRLEPVPGGLRVERTWEGWPAGSAGFLPGDIVMSLDGDPVRSLDDLHRLVLPPAITAFDVRVRRGRRILRLPLSLDARAADRTVPE
jgi:hypothetical protein